MDETRSKVWLIYTVHTKDKEVQALIWQIFVHQKFFLSLNAASHQLDQIIVLQFCNKLNFIFEFCETLS
jgi:hypothetical protein